MDNDMDRTQVNRRWDELEADGVPMDREAVSRRWDQLEQGTSTAKPHAEQDAEADEEERRRRRAATAAVITTIFGPQP